MGHFPVLFGMCTPPEQQKVPQFPRWATCLPQWNDKVKSTCADIKEKAYAEHVQEINALHPAFRGLRYLKETFEEAALALVKEHNLQQKLQSDKAFQLQYLVCAIQACKRHDLPTVYKIASSAES
eukprot:6692050-Alexandrium_andersonii.AAC.1